MKGMILKIEKVHEALQASEICKHHALEINYFLKPEKKSFCGTCAAISDTDVLLKDITIEQEMDDEDPMCFLDVEAEAFVLDAKAFFQKNITIGDKVSFTGKIIFIAISSGFLDIFVIRFKNFLIQNFFVIHSKNSKRYDISEHFQNI